VLQPEDFGTTPIEPSEKSGMYIADLISEVIRDFQFGTDGAKIYSGKGDHKQALVLNSSFNYSLLLDEFLENCLKNVEIVTHESEAENRGLMSSLLEVIGVPRKQ
jgi:hypothetical protein